MDDTLDSRFSAACGIAREAGALALAAFRDRPADSAIELKGPQDYLTETDAQVENLIRKRIENLFPNDSFFGEEGGGEFGRDVWVVDPIDGTANFARGVPHFCISIAFVRDRQAMIGAVYDPVHDELFAAQNGKGATKNGKPIHVSKTPDLEHATVEAGWSSRLPPEPYVELVGKLKKAGANVRRAGSGTLGLAYVADGRSDAYCELHINSWDALAAIVLIKEAGGFVNDFLANDGLLKGNPVLGCTPAIKVPMIAIMNLAPD
jgi:myo-inositol-1(or 4)-monophosphatase